MDIHNLKKGIILSKNEPFLKQNHKTTNQVNHTNISFIMPSQLNPQVSSNKEKSFTTHHKNQNSQITTHHSYNNSLDLNYLRSQETKNNYLSPVNNQLSRQNTYVQSFLSQNFIQMNQPFQSKKLNCAQTVISTQDSVIINKDFEDVKSMGKISDNFNGNSFIIDSYRLQIQNLKNKFNDQKSTTLLHLSQEIAKNNELTKEINLLKFKNTQSTMKLQQKQGINTTIRTRIQDMKNNEEKKLLQMRQIIQKQYNNKLQFQLDKTKQILQQQQRSKSLLQNEKIYFQNLIAQKDKKVNSLQSKFAEKDKQLKEKIAFYELQIRKFQGNKNRLQIEAQNSKKLVKLQRQKNEKQKNEIDKLIYFEDDLIHAKDFDKLKDQNAFLKTQNQQMYEQHRTYILEVTQQRQALQLEIFKMGVQMKNMEKSLANDRAKISKFLQNNDKLVLIKLQNDYNFMKKQFQETKDKNQELMISINHKQQEISDLRLMLSENKKVNQLKSSNIMGQMNIKNIQNIISMYETRLEDVNCILKIKDAQNQKNKRILEYLTTQLRKIREEKNINCMKEKNSQNNLKSDIEILKRSHEVEISLIQKKLSNLQNLLNRKTKEIIDKDILIKSILMQKSKIQQNYKNACKRQKYLSLSKKEISNNHNMVKSQLKGLNKSQSQCCLQYKRRGIKYVEEVSVIQVLNENEEIMNKQVETVDVI